MVVKSNLNFVDFALWSSRIALNPQTFITWVSLPSILDIIIMIMIMMLPKYWILWSKLFFRDRRLLEIIGLKNSTTKVMISKLMRGTLLRELMKTIDDILQRCKFDGNVGCQNTKNWKIELKHWTTLSPDKKFSGSDRWVARGFHLSIWHLRISTWSGGGDTHNHSLTSKVVPKT